MSACTQSLLLLLMVYVDDFKMTGPSGNVDAGWATIASGIKLVGVGPVSIELGCDHALFKGTVDGKPVWGDPLLNAATHGVVCGGIPRSGRETGSALPQA